jgi:hypothetical protein
VPRLSEHAALPPQPCLIFREISQVFSGSGSRPEDISRKTPSFIIFFTSHHIRSNAAVRRVA